MGMKKNKKFIPKINKKDMRLAIGIEALFLIVSFLGIPFIKLYADFLVEGKELGAAFIVAFCLMCVFIVKISFCFQKLKNDYTEKNKLNEIWENFVVNIMYLFGNVAFLIYIFIMGLIKKIGWENAAELAFLLSFAITFYVFELFKTKSDTRQTKNVSQDSSQVLRILESQLDEKYKQIERLQKLVDQSQQLQLQTQKQLSSANEKVKQLESAPKSDYKDAKNKTDIKYK